MLFSKKGKPPPTPPKEESANRLQTRYSSRYRYGQTLEYGHKNGLHARYSSKYRHEGTLEHRHTSGLHARRPSQYSQRGQTLCNIRQARKLGLPPFGRVGVGIGRDSGLVFGGAGWGSWRTGSECPGLQHSPYWTATWVIPPCEMSEVTVQNG